MSSDQQDQQHNINNQCYQVENSELVCECQEYVARQYEQPEVKIDPVAPADPPTDPEQKQGVNKHQDSDDPQHCRWNAAAVIAEAGDARDTEGQPDHP